jgi:hypothetical protein
MDNLEDRITSDKLSKFRGTAKVRLEHLYFPSQVPRELNRGNVERLKDIFGKEGCRRLNPKNQVPTVIGIHALESSIAQSGTSLSDLLNNPKGVTPELSFPSDFRLECLHGKHRIQAAKESRCLKAEEKWWIVHLYLTGIP